MPHRIRNIRCLQLGRDLLFMRSFPFPEQKFFRHADINEIPGEDLVFGSLSDVYKNQDPRRSGSKASIHSIIVEDIRPRNQRDILFDRHCRIAFATFRSPRARIPSSTVTSASCQLYLILFLFNCSLNFMVDNHMHDPRNSSLVHICAHWNGVNGFGTKNEVLTVIWHFPFRCSFGIS